MFLAFKFKHDNMFDLKVRPKLWIGIICLFYNGLVGKVLIHVLIKYNKSNDLYNNRLINKNTYFLLNIQIKMISEKKDISNMW